MELAMNVRHHLRTPAHFATAAFAAVGALLAAVPLSAQAPNQMYAQISEQLAIDTKCQVLSPPQRLAMELFADEFRTQVTPADQSAVATWLEGVKTSLAGVPCNDPRLTGPIKATGDAATIQQDIWASRVHAIVGLRNSTNWASMSEISGVKNTAADRAMDALRNRNRDAARQFSEQARREAERVLSILCPTKSIARANCPALAAPLNPGEDQLAAAWLARVEKYAAQMPGARLDGKPVLPAGVTDWTELLSVTSVEMALAASGFEVPCEAKGYVVRPDGPMPKEYLDTTPATIFSARDGFEAGRGEITLFGTTPTLQGPWVESLRSQTMGLVRCQSAP